MLSPRFFKLKIVVFFIAMVFIMTAIASRTPRNFPMASEVNIPQNISLSEAASMLAEKHIITSPFLFKAIITAFHRGRIVAGDYVFSEKAGLQTVAERISSGDQGLTPIKIMIPEGSTVSDIAFILLKKIPNFSAPYFMRIAHGQEGFLFPDTYLFYPHEKTDEIMKTFRDTFDAKLKTLTNDIALSHHTAKDIIIMASLLEKEATSTNDRIIISGILWKRIDEGLALQVDPPLAYLKGNVSSYTSLDDTKIDSPYNTYKYKGLPKGPISNPGLDALTAAAHPVRSTYYFYLSDAKGNMHYSRTYDEHLINKKKYVN